MKMKECLSDASVGDRFVWPYLLDDTLIFNACCLGPNWECQSVV